MTGDHFEQAPFAVHEIDANGVIQMVNPAECRLLGYRREEMVGRQVWEFVTAESRAESRVSVLEKLSGARKLIPFERELVDAQGGRRFFEIHE